MTTNYQRKNLFTVNLIILVVETSVFGQLTFPALCPIHGWQVTTFCISPKLSAVDQLIRPIQPSTPPGPVNA